MLGREGTSSGIGGRQALSQERLKDEKEWAIQRIGENTSGLWKGPGMGN